MGFGTQLQGRISHRALIEVQDIEIKVLENIKRCMALRVESDRQYATSLAKVIAQAQKVDSSEFSDTLTFLKVWDNIVSESDVFLKQVRENADTLAGRTLDTMTTIINEKKNMRRFYVEERNRLETDFSRVS
ncbi:hypothetical protein LOTGIDRAFT_131117 [Lottia gigantea]|uniref:FCH domain-containing protein n=1 Tax=Lottia gigantea TaxID=225164 RepID=V3Z3B5_LOTGI|nr:hypothetical protein LOTGIDRAFT_131117 [Lottia gigantea]ESO85113.1 hypothetical protein LOTGIDRAFT_131117 [Lottia gigantea]